LLELTRWQNMGRAAPRLIPVQLESGSSIEVVVFDLTQMVFSLFSDKDLMRPDNFLFDLDQLRAAPLPVGPNDLIKSFLHT